MGCGQSAPSADQAKPDERHEADAKPSGAAAPNPPAVPGAVPANSTILFVLGGPGSGKGTQCDRIKERYEGVVHLSAGDLLRAEVASGSEVGKKCDQMMKEGELVPMSVTIGLLKNAMIQSGGTLFLIDGFPRALDQAQSFEADILPAKAVLFFDCTEEEMEKRLIKRGETSGRADDNAETIRKRFKTFVEQSLPVKATYVEKGNAHVINACRTPDDVFEDVKAALDALGLPIKGAQQPAAEEEGGGVGMMGAAAGAGAGGFGFGGGGGEGGDEE